VLDLIHLQMTLSYTNIVCQPITRICYLYHAATRRFGQKDFFTEPLKSGKTYHFRSPSLNYFKGNLKTHYFANTWPPGDCLQCLWYDILNILHSTNSYEWMNEWRLTTICGLEWRVTKIHDRWPQLAVSDCVITASDEARNLGVIIDLELSMKRQVQMVSRSCFFQLRQTRLL